MSGMLESLPEAPEGPVQADVGGLPGASDQLADGGVRKQLPVGQPQYLLITRTKGRHGRNDLLIGGLLYDDGLGGNGLVGLESCQLGDQAAGSPTPSQVIHENEACNAVQPGEFLVSLGNFPALAPRHNEDVGGGVVGIIVLEPAEEVGENGAMMRLK
jgi:hypothetical protein